MPERSSITAHCTQEQMLQALDAAYGQTLLAAKRDTATPVIGIAAQGIANFREVVSGDWPLRPEQSNIHEGFGPFVAKNIDDFNEPLGSMLHTLVACVREGGMHLDELQQKIATLSRHTGLSL